MKTFTFGSVCSGIEAASVAWQGLGLMQLWFSEIEPFPCDVLNHYFPDVINVGDMRQIPERIRRSMLNAPDVVAGGTPCQAFSVAGLRQSLEDERGNLTLTFCDIVDAIDAKRAVQRREPVVVFWENVPGVLNTPDNAFGCFLGRLAGEAVPLVAPGGRWTDAGCIVGPQRTLGWRTLDAQYFGLAQRRERVFVIGSARDGFDPVEILFEPESVRRNSPPSREARKVVAAIPSRSSAGGGFGTDFDCDGGIVAAEIAGTIDASFGRLQGCSGQDMNHGHSHLVATAYGGNNCGGAIEVASALRATSNDLDFERDTFVAVPVDCGDASQGVPCVAFSATHDGRDAMDELSPTLRAMGSKKGHPNAAGQVAIVSESLERRPRFAVRRLTPRECERLQGFPDDWTLIQRAKGPAADGPRYKAIGNSWAVPVVRWLGARLVKHLQDLDASSTTRMEATNACENK